MMRATVFCLFLIYFSITTVQGAERNSRCDTGWIPLEDEKCVRLFETFATREQAEDVCQTHGGTLVAVMSEEHQRVLTELVLNSSNAINVWIGAQRRSGNSSEFVWNDGSTVRRYTSWATGHPTNSIGRNCVQMRSELSRTQRSDMEWVDIACVIANWFICQKLQMWSPENVQQALLNLRRELRDSDYSVSNEITDMKRQLEVAQTELTHLQANPVPIGFIYVQLSNEPLPSTLWPTVQWTQVTSQYAGLFFRAEGGSSAAFGQIQTEGSPRLTSVRGRIALSAATSSITVAPGVATPNLSVGATGATNHWGMSFTVSSAEVRPRNSAIRIWRRSG
ncbi:uncharacterized protein LOC119085197 [Bradysia coprophila]|uniref:uncharacterized protein LOC119085197 n=1 Tax=Bradysia coprophila TaxID=38358 RepID=UPI00187DCE15|nr:uncharacterized protein LOC119085197 [Bradysia coprophila]